MVNNNFSPENTIMNFFSILRHASSTAPYPAAFNFLSTSYKQQFSYNEFLNSLSNFAHINLIKLIKDDTDTYFTYFIELEVLKTDSHFAYFFGWIQMELEDKNYKIKNIELLPEDFISPEYYGWIIDAKEYVQSHYGSQGLIQMQSPVVFDGNIKEIYAMGTNGNSYLFKFAHLTNGIDVEIGKYILCNEEWSPIIPIKLEDALKIIESDKALQQKYILDPKGVLENLGVDTSALTIKVPIPSETEMLGGAFVKICPEVCYAGVGAGITGYEKTFDKAPQPKPPKPPKPKPKPLPPGSVLPKPPEE